MPIFPSVEWFNAVRTVFNGDDSYQKAGGGACDATVGIVTGDKFFVLIFEAKECVDAREIGEDDLSDADFYLEMPYLQWEEMLRNIGVNGSADLHHTLNTLDLERPEGLVQTQNGDQYRQDLFFRYNQTFQYFFDASARVETKFQASVAKSGDS